MSHADGKKADIGLGNVDDTSDVNKPVSIATQTALNAKVNTSALAPVATGGAYSNLTGLPTIPAAQVSPDWNSTVSPTKILNKPPQAKNWSGSTTGGVAIIYLTSNGLSTGTAFYTAIEGILVMFTGNDNNLGKSYTVSVDLKTLTITCTQQSFSGITVLSIPVLGSVSISAVPNGTGLKVLINGIPA